MRRTESGSWPELGFSGRSSPPPPQGNNACLIFLITKGRMALARCANWLIANWLGSVMSPSASESIWPYLHTAFYRIHPSIPPSLIQSCNHCHPTALLSCYLAVRILRTSYTVRSTHCEGSTALHSQPAASQWSDGIPAACRHPCRPAHRSGGKERKKRPVRVVAGRQTDRQTGGATASRTSFDWTIRISSACRMRRTHARTRVDSVSTFPILLMQAGHDGRCPCSYWCVRRAPYSHQPGTPRPRPRPRPRHPASQPARSSVFGERQPKSFLLNCEPLRCQQTYIHISSLLTLPCFSTYGYAVGSAITTNHPNHLWLIPGLSVSNSNDLLQRIINHHHHSMVDR